MTQPKFRFEIVLPGIGDPQNDNVDVRIETECGVFMATFFTVQNIVELFNKNKKTGECKHGLYLWASDMIIVEQLSCEVIRETIIGLMESSEFEDACRKIDKGNTLDSPL